MKATIVIPTYNERLALPGLLRTLSASPSVEEIIVVDDNSPDGTAEAARGIATVRVLERPRKLGLGSAVRLGAANARADYILVMDGDGQHSPEDALRMFEELNPGTDIVVGSRFIGHQETPGLSRKRRLLSKSLTRIIHYGRPIRGTTDPLTGLFLTRRSYILATKTKGFKILLEILLRNPHLRIRDVPITLGSRTYGNSKANMSEVVELTKTLLLTPRGKYHRV